jgi:hypothetical protein
LPYKSDEEATIDGEVYVNLSVIALASAFFWLGDGVFAMLHLSIFATLSEADHTVGRAL